MKRFKSVRCKIPFFNPVLGILHENQIIQMLRDLNISYHFLFICIKIKDQTLFNYDEEINLFLFSGAKTAISLAYERVEYSVLCPEPEYG